MSPLETAAFLADLAQVVQQVHDRGHVQGELTPDGIVLDGKWSRLRDRPITERRDAASSDRIRGAVSAYTPPDWLRPGVDFSDRRADIYILGVILYQMLSGVLPFKGRPGSPELVEEILANAPMPPRQVDPSIPVVLEEICLKAMAEDPAARYASAAALASALRRAAKPSRKGFWK
jgi:serine/threonine protein kinase